MNSPDNITSETEWQAMPKDAHKFEVRIILSEPQFKKIRKGFHSQNTDEQWRIVMTDHVLNFYRNWTKEIVYAIPFQRVKNSSQYFAGEVFVNLEVMTGKTTNQQDKRVVTKLFKDYFDIDLATRKKSGNNNQLSGLVIFYALLFLAGVGFYFWMIS